MTDPAPVSSRTAPLRLRSEGLTWRQTGNEVVILDIDDAAYFALNPVGAELWAALSSGTTLDQLVALLEHRYRLPRETSRADVTDFLTDLRTAGLLVEGSHA